MGFPQEAGPFPEKKSNPSQGGPLPSGRMEGPCQEHRSQEEEGEGGTESTSERVDNQYTERKYKMQTVFPCTSHERPENEI